MTPTQNTGDMLDFCYSANLNKREPAAFSFEGGGFVRVGTLPRDRFAFCKER